jgi:hypothetical protein
MVTPYNSKISKPDSGVEGKNHGEHRASLGKEEEKTAWNKESAHANYQISQCFGLLLSSSQDWD